jgi:hypothetical protein
MEKTVIAAGGSGAEVAFVNEDAVHAAECEISHYSRPGHSAADYQDFGFEDRFSRCFAFLKRDWIHGALLFFGGIDRNVRVPGLQTT